MLEGGAGMLEQRTGMKRCLHVSYALKSYLADTDNRQSKPPSHP